jgi:hypothetical protein
MNLKRPWAIGPFANAIGSLLLLGVLALVMFTALRSPLKDDIAWLLYVARRWIAGKELYVDVVEVNPPLIIWISAIPLKIARWWNINQQFVAMPFFATVVLACAWWSAVLLRSWGGLFEGRFPTFAVIGAVLLLIPAGDLGQREHLLVAAFLPYLILFARTLSDRDVLTDARRGATLPPSSWTGSTGPSLSASSAADHVAEADGPVEPGHDVTQFLAPASRVPGQWSRYTTPIAAGMLVALGCALKPQYGLVLAALELVALSHRLRPWRAAPLAAAATFIAYVGLVALICPAYLRRAVPMALALYGATDVSFRVLLGYIAPLLVAEGLVAMLWWRDRKAPTRAPLLLTGIVFAAVSSLICFIDGKDWFYHRLPATVVTVLILILSAAWTLRERYTKGSDVWRTDPAARRWLMVSGLAVALFCVAAMQRLGPEMRQAVEPRATTVARLEALIRLHHARSYVAFSEWIALGFPVVNNTGVVWASRFDSMWALKGELWAARADPSAAREWPIARWVAHDFLATCPDLAVVDTREKLNYIGVLGAAEPRFAHAWARYKQIVAFDGLKVYKRTRPGCIEPWVAAEGPPGGIAVR